MTGTTVTLLRSVVLGLAVTVCGVERDEAPRAPERPPQPAESFVAEPPPDPARYTVHDIVDHSVGILRYRLTVEMTTPETDSTRIVEAMMRAALEVHSRYQPDVVGARLWRVWPPPPELSQEEFDVLTADEMTTYFRQRWALRTVHYALDRCGWTGRDCDRTLWDDVAPREMPKSLLKVCPRVMTEPCGWLRP